MKILLPLIASALTLGACSSTPAPEPITWQLDRQAYQARVRMHDCMAAVKAGQRDDCKPEIRAVYETQQAKQNGRFSDIGNAGY